MERHDEQTSEIEEGLKEDQERREAGDLPSEWRAGFNRQLRAERPLPSKIHYYFMLFAIFLVMIVEGWNDASQGPLLPLLQRYYNVDYIVISLIWVTYSIGVIIGAISNIYLSDTLGFGWLTSLGAVLQSIAYALMCFGGPFPLFIMAYLIAGLGLCWQFAQVSTIAARFPNATKIMFITHGMYGLGATVSPFFSTIFVKRVTERFYLYYTVSLALAAMTAVTLVIVFRGRTVDQCVGKSAPAVVERGEVGIKENQAEVAVLPASSGMVPPVEESKDEVVGPSPVKERSGSAKLRAIFTSPPAWCLVTYAFLYLGAEVSIAGWAVTFLIEERGGDSSAGYVSAGFFGGLTLGRFVLLPVSRWLGHRTSVFVYTSIAIALELIIWFVPSLIGSAICYALIGFAIGPTYPTCVMILTEIMPHDLHSGTIGLMACVSVLGGAVVPFITGVIANRHGVWILQPLAIAVFSASLVVFAFVARTKVIIQ